MINCRFKLLSIVSTILVSALALSCSTQPQEQIAPSPPVNHPPIIDGIASALEWKPSSEGKLLCAATDQDGDALTYTWSAEKGTIKGNGSEAIWIAPDAIGEYEVTVNVTDNKGGEATATKKFKVVVNPYGGEEPDKTIYFRLSLPSSEVVTESRRVRILTTSVVECIPQNRELSQLNFKWITDGGRLMAPDLASGKANSVGWIAPGVAGKFTLTLIVTDESGNEAKGEVNFDVFCCGPDTDTYTDSH